MLGSGIRIAPGFLDFALVQPLFTRFPRPSVSRRPIPGDTYIAQKNNLKKCSIFFGERCINYRASFLSFRKPTNRRITTTMSKKLFAYLMLPLALLFCNSSENSAAQNGTSPAAPTGILEKMIVANGVVTMNVDLRHLNGNNSASDQSRLDTLQFAVAPQSFFTVLVFNNLLRTPESGAQMTLTSQNSVTLSGALKDSQLVIEKRASSEAFDLVVRDSKTGFVFFNIDGHSYNYDSGQHLLNISDGRLLISNEFATRLGHPAQGGASAGNISVRATMYPIETDRIVNGAVTSAVMPAVGTVPGPDVIVGELPQVSQASSPNSGIEGNYVGLGVGNHFLQCRN